MSLRLPDLDVPVQWLLLPNQSTGSSNPLETLNTSWQVAVPDSMALGHGLGMF
jgi:hypothetical protein